jgi:hypothetical protein
LTSNILLKLGELENDVRNFEYNWRTVKYEYKKILRSSNNSLVVEIGGYLENFKSLKGKEW